jgi:MYXO-CTERM domain-containing protein
MRLQRIGLMAAALFVLFVMAPRAEAVILASDDMSAPGSGTGWAAGNNWEGLGGGVVSTADVASFRDFAAPINGTNQVTYIRFDFTQSVPGTGAQWGGASLFEGVEGAEATETFFAGDPGQAPNQYGLDLQSAAAGTLFSGIPINNQLHTIITEIDTTPAGAAANYRLWVDNFNINAPTATKAVAISPIDAPWGTFRMNSDASNTDFFDNLTIATTSREVGLVPEPTFLGLFGLFGVAMLGMIRRRR